MADWSTRNARTLLNVLQAAGQSGDLRVLSFRDHSLRGEMFSPSEDLSGADLREADLSDAQLSGVQLCDASLTGARLTSSHLDGANLRGASLSYAVLDRASLIGADLQGCALDGTSWRRARLIGAQVDLTAVPRNRLLGAALPGVTPRLCVSGPVTSCVFAISSNLTLLATHADDGVQLWDLATERCLTVLPIEGEQVEDIAFGDLSDGRAILAGSGSDGAVRIWDPTTGEHLSTLTGAGGKAPRLAFTQLIDGRTILATGGGYDDNDDDDDDDDGLNLSLGVVYLWDPVTGEHLTTLTHRDSKIRALAFGALRDGRTILATGAGEIDSRGYTHGVIHIWDPTTGEHLSTLAGPHSNVSRLAFGALDDGSTTLATGSGQFYENIYLLDPTTGQQLDTLPAGNEVAGAITFAELPDGRTILASVAQNEDIHLWDPTTKETVRTLTGNNLILELASAQLPDGRTIFVSGSVDQGYDEYVELWDSLTGHPRPLSDGDGWTLAVAFMQLSDGRTILASGGRDGLIHLWDTVTAEHLSTLTGHDDRVLTVASARLPDGRPILASASESYRHRPSRATVHVWDPITGERLHTVTDSRRLAQTMTLTGLADGRAILTSGGGYVDRASHETHGVIHLWDLTTEEPLSSLAEHENWVWTTALTQLPGGRTILATGTSGSDKERDRRQGVIHIWDALTGEHLNKLIGHVDIIRELQFTQLPDGRTILASCGGDSPEGGDGKVHLWDPITGQRVHTFTDDRNMLQTISFVPLPDGRTALAIGGGETVRVWDLSVASLPRRRFLRTRGSSPPDMTPALICTHRFPAQVAALAWSRETSTLAAGLANASVVLSGLDGTSLREQATLLMLPEGHATLYPDGSYRLTGDPDGRFWWSAGLCRFEPGELDGYAGIRRLD